LGSHQFSQDDWGVAVRLAEAVLTDPAGSGALTVAVAKEVAIGKAVGPGPVGAGVACMVGVEDCA